MSQLRIKVKPSSNKNRIVKMEDGTYKIWIKSAPEKGKANKELQKYLKKNTGVPVRIVSGLTSENKTIEFDIEEKEFIAKLEELATETQRTQR
ncbi:DUF167 domain-containing protein [candidate division WOR-3 bacterium]|nr:DUF167 domain-containing protein [candidate division WOR-3 bacterium]